MTQTTSRDLRVLICDDEFLLAMDMAEQFEALQADVVGTVGTLGELQNAVMEESCRANAVVLDVRLADGDAFDLIPLLESRGLAVAISSGFGAEDRPQRFSHVPWLGKPTTADKIAQALCDVMDARSTGQSV